MIMIEMVGKYRLLCVTHSCVMEGWIVPIVREWVCNFVWRTTMLVGVVTYLFNRSVISFKFSSKNCSMKLPMLVFSWLPLSKSEPVPYAYRLTSTPLWPCVVHCRHEVNKMCSPICTSMHTNLPQVELEWIPYQPRSDREQTAMGSTWGMLAPFP